MTVSLSSPAGICVSVAGETVDQAIDIAKHSETLADIIEIRLDSLSQPEVEPFMKNLTKPLLFTNRPQWEGGSFKGSEASRIGLLQEAIESDCALVDLELNSAPELRAELLDVLLKHPGTAMIISWHDFSGTPSNEELGEILQQQMESGAHVGKIVTMAKSFEDVLKILNLQTLAAENNFPLIAFCMGQMGMVSRLSTLRLGGFMTYAAPDGGNESAPGQLEVTTLRTMLNKLASVG